MAKSKIETKSCKSPKGYRATIIWKDDFPPCIEKEKNLLKLSGKLWNEFVSLPVEHQSELKEMEFFIHGIQGIISTRIARKQNPDLYSKGGKNEKN